MSRLSYIAEAVSAAATLARHCDDQEQLGAILARTSSMVTAAWSVEWKTLKCAQCAQQFWRAVILEVHNVNAIEFVCDERNNPPGVAGRVDLSWQPRNSVEMYEMRIEPEKHD